MKYYWIIFSLIGVWGCANIAASSQVPVLQNRTLRISADIAGFEYQWKECVKRFLGICTKEAMKKETYDLTDIDTRKKLIAMDFVARVRDKQ